MPSHYTDDKIDRLYMPRGRSVAATPEPGRFVNDIFGTAATDAELSEFDALYGDRSEDDKLTEDILGGSISPQLDLLKHTQYLAEKYNISMEGRTRQDIIESVRKIKELSTQHGVPLKVGSVVPRELADGLRNFSSYYQDIDKLTSPGAMGVGGGYSYRGKDPFPSEREKSLINEAGGMLSKGAAAGVTGVSFRQEEIRKILEGDLPSPLREPLFGAAPSSTFGDKLEDTKVQLRYEWEEIKKGNFRPSWEEFLRMKGLPADTGIFKGIVSEGPGPTGPPQPAPRKPQPRQPVATSIGGANAQLKKDIVKHASTPEQKKSALIVALEEVKNFEELLGNKGFNASTRQLVEDNLQFWKKQVKANQP